MTFDRRKNSTATSIENPHAFSYWGVYGRMIVIYQAEFWVITGLICLFFYLVLDLYKMVSDGVGDIIFKFQAAFSSGDFSAITPAEIKQFKETMEGIPPQWYLALYTMSWVFTIPAGIF